MRLNNFVPIILLLVLSGNGLAQLDSLRFKHHIIADPLPGLAEYGTGGFALADFDMDGDLDVTISRRPDAGKCYWYRNEGKTWTQHLVGIADQAQLGATSTDINSDSFPDLVMGRIWFQNPGSLATNPDSPWIKNIYKGGLTNENHDIGLGDFNNDKKLDVLCYAQNDQGGTLRWFDTSNAANWSFTDVAVGLSQSVRTRDDATRGIHGGFAPAGIGDLDRDLYEDIVMPLGWFRNPGKMHGKKWEFVPWPFPMGVVPNPYGISTRSWVCNLDKDDDNDIVLTDCDVEGSKGYWIENGGAGKFSLHRLPGPGGPTGSFHSLAVADFDNDGDLDIFTGEQEDPNPGMKPKDLKERGIVWENTGSVRKPEFTVRIIHTDNPGWHDIRAGDVDGDGDIDLVSKIWNKDGASYHADFWENLTIRK